MSLRRKGRERSGISQFPNNFEGGQQGGGGKHIININQKIREGGDCCVCGG